MSADAARWPRLSDAFARLGIPAAIVDVESTGGNLSDDRITEVAVLRFSDGRISRYSRLVNPQQRIPEFITSLTGISNEMVAGAPLFADIAPTLLPLLRGTLLAAHNSRFDYSFLCGEFARAGYGFAAPALCTVRMSRKLYPQFHKHSLESIIDRFGIATQSRHRAMADVEALADFLELSLAGAEDGGADWADLCRSLASPPILPSWLESGLAQQLYALPDRCGISLWQDRSGRVFAVKTHRKAFAEISAHLNGSRAAEALRTAASVRFIPAVGPLHALQLKAAALDEHGLMPSESSPDCFTVYFLPDSRGRLQAEIAPLSNGSLPRRGYGLFLHKKAARRALADWAQTQGLCFEALGILPYGSGENRMPCPARSAGTCLSDCPASDGIETQNRRIRESATLLPVTGWGHAHDVEITETDLFSGQTETLRCTSGTLSLADGRLYFDDSLPVLLKEKFKERSSIRVLC